MILQSTAFPCAERTRRKFSERFKSIIDAYNAGGTENEAYYEQMVTFLEEMRQENQRASTEGLTEEEQQLVKRARNKKVTSKPRNVDIHIYKWATAFEALMGYLHISGQEDRRDELMEEAMRIISGAEGKPSL